MINSNKSDSIEAIPRRPDIIASLENLMINIESLKSSIDVLESALSDVTVNRSEDSCSKDGVLSQQSSSTVRRTIDDEVEKIQRLDTQICRLIDNLDL